MARPSKALGAMSKNLTKEERMLRQTQEDLLRGADDNIAPSYYLVDRQLEIFEWLVEEMEASKMLSNIDSPNLSAFAFALTQLEHINDMINRNPDNLFDKAVLQARAQLIKETQRFTNEFCLSPQSRAKMGNANIAKKEKAQDPLLKALSGGKN